MHPCVRRKSCLHRKVPEILSRIPTPFDGDLRKEESPMPHAFHDEAVPADDDHSGKVPRIVEHQFLGNGQQRHLDRYEVQFILTEIGETRVMAGRLRGTPYRIRQGHDRIRKPYASPQIAGGILVQGYEDPAHLGGEGGIGDVHHTTTDLCVHTYACEVYSGLPQCHSINPSWNSP